MPMAAMYGSSGQLGLSTTIAALLVICGCLILAGLARGTTLPHSPKEWRTYDWPIIGSALQFYSRRRDMLIQGSKWSASGNFSFYVGKKHIISLNCLAGRRMFYESRELNFAAGFVELLAGIPSLGNPDKEEAWSRYFNKVIFALTRRETLVPQLVTWSNDIQTVCDELASKLLEKANTEWRILNPFVDIYELVYKLTIRLVGSTEIAEDRKSLIWTLSIFERFEKSSSTAGFVFPWLITPAHIVRMVLGIRLYVRLSRIIQTRKYSSIIRHDALDYLLSQGADPATIVKFQIGAMWAGVITTGAIGSWMPILLASYPIWKEKCRHEVQTSIMKHRKSRNQSSSDVLHSLTLDVWESDFPILHSCIRETIRVSMPGTVFRKNTSGKDLLIGDTGEVIPKGSFVAYLIDNVHMNPELYPDPLEFNPGRYLDAKKILVNDPHKFVGWGSGRHPCMGTRVAQLEITMIIAHLLANFDFEIQDSSGLPSPQPPLLPDRNGHKICKPSTPVLLRYKAQPTTL
ncbi:cytochrome P450, partial [Xylaria castorea]